MSFITIFDVRDQLNITNSNSDDELEGYVDAACDIVEQWAGAVEQRVIVGEFVDMLGYSQATFIDPLGRSSLGTRTMVLRHRPVISVESITSSPSGLTFDPAWFNVDQLTGIVRRIDGSTFFGQMIVSYTAGYAVAPPWAVLAAKIITQNLWRTQRGTRRGMGDDPGVIAGIGYLVPNQAAALLEPHRQMPSVG
jgi:hypothetical protein